MHKFLLFLLPFTLFASQGYREPWGEDVFLFKKPETLEKAKENSIATQVADQVIRFHQEVISPVDGPRSHFRPTSSRYMQLAMYRYGFFQGFLMGCDRLLRENSDPWVYRIREFGGEVYKYDPALVDK